MANDTQQKPFSPDNLTAMTYPPLLDGLWSKNTLLAAGMVIGPAAAASSTFKGSLALAMAFSLITAVTVVIGSLLPRTLVYALRIILYTLIGSLVYIPVQLLLEITFPGELLALGVFIPVLLINPLIVIRSEQRFFKQPKERMIADLLMHILGFDLVIILLGFIREVFATGAINGYILGIHFTFPILGATCGGFLLLGVTAGLFRRLRRLAMANAKKKIGK